MTVVSKVDLARVRVVSMRELTLHTAAVVDRLRMENCPRAIVKHGRFQAALWPLPAGIESDVLAHAVDAGRFVVERPNRAVAVQDLEGQEDEDPADEGDPTFDAPGSGTSQDRAPDKTYGIATMSELSQNPSAVVSRVRDGEHLVLTRHGRFLALLVPFPPNLESRLLASVGEFMETLDDGSRSRGSGLAVDVAEAWTG